MRRNFGYIPLESDDEGTGAMSNYVQTELYLRKQPGSAHAVEYLCTVAATNGPAQAVAVAPSNVLRASNLLFGTGIGVVSTLHDSDPANLLVQARLSVATGATEVALPAIDLPDTAVLGELKNSLGLTTPVTIDITSMGGGADLAKAEHAYLLGADFVSFTPGEGIGAGPSQTANLVALAGELQLGGVKVASETNRHLTALRSNGWALAAGNARACLPISLPGG